jgi:cation/acetate symporter
MVSTTWVQFLKGTLLVIFSGILTWMILSKGLTVQKGGRDGYEFRSFTTTTTDLENSDGSVAELQNVDVLPDENGWEKTRQKFLRLKSRDSGLVSVWHVQASEKDSNTVSLSETQTLAKIVTPSGRQIEINGQPSNKKKGDPELHPVGHIHSLPDGQTSTGPLSPLSYFSVLQKSEVVLWRNEKIVHPDKSETTVYYPKLTSGAQILRPGEHPTFRGIRSEKLSDKVNFLSLMLALFCGTASLPHILIRYYTVKDESSARRSTIVGIAAIGFFYILTLYLGLGAMTSGAIDLSDENMAAPLLAKSMNTWLFAAISAIAFTTVLGTVSGLILASAGAVTHDLLSSAFGWQMTDTEKVRVAKISSVFVGAIAIVLGILFKNMNVSFLVGWAFSVAASANLPALIMILFWPRVTRQGIIAGIVVGMVSALGWILLSAEAFEKVYGLDLAKTPAIVPFSQPGIVTIPLGFLTLIIVSLMTSGRSTSSMTATSRS